MINNMNVENWSRKKFVLVWIVIIIIIIFIIINEVKFHTIELILSSEQKVYYIKDSKQEIVKKELEKVQIHIQDEEHITKIVICKSNGLGINGTIEIYIKDNLENKYTKKEIIDDVYFFDELL